MRRNLLAAHTLAGHLLGVPLQPELSFEVPVASYTFPHKRLGYRVTRIDVGRDIASVLSTVKPDEPAPIMAVASTPHGPCHKCAPKKPGMVC